MNMNMENNNITKDEYINQLESLVEQYKELVEKQNEQMEEVVVNVHFMKEDIDALEEENKMLKEKINKLNEEKILRYMRKENHYTETKYDDEEENIQIEEDDEIPF